jgi:hypothetical protein
MRSLFPLFILHHIALQPPRSLDGAATVPQLRRRLFWMTTNYNYFPLTSLAAVLQLYGSTFVPDHLLAHDSLLIASS